MRGWSGPMRRCTRQRRGAPVLSLGAPLWQGCEVQMCTLDRTCWMTAQGGRISTQSILYLSCPCLRVWTIGYRKSTWINKDFTVICWGHRYDIMEDSRNSYFWLEGSCVTEALRVCLCVSKHFKLLGRYSVVIYHEILYIWDKALVAKLFVIDLTLQWHFVPWMALCHKVPPPPPRPSNTHTWSFPL